MLPRGSTVEEGVQPPNSPSEYAVLMNRFKLLNLVQRVAHKDVMEMIDAVGLEALRYKGSVQQWMIQEGDDDERGDERRTAARLSSSPHSRAVSGARTGLKSRDGVPGRNKEEVFRHAKSSFGLSSQPQQAHQRQRHDDTLKLQETRTLRSQRPQAEEEELFSRLAEPRQRLGANLEHGVTSRPPMGAAGGAVMRGNDNMRHAADGARAHDGYGNRPRGESHGSKYNRVLSGANGRYHESQEKENAAHYRSRGGEYDNAVDGSDADGIERPSFEPSYASFKYQQAIRTSRGNEHHSSRYPLGQGWHHHRYRHHQHHREDGGDRVKVVSKPSFTAVHHSDADSGKPAGIDAKVGHDTSEGDLVSSGDHRLAFMAGYSSASPLTTLGSISSGTPRQQQLMLQTQLSESGSVRQLRSGGFGPKAKPAGAVNTPTVPVDVIHHAAALLSKPVSLRHGQAAASAAANAKTIESDDSTKMYSKAFSETEVGRQEQRRKSSRKEEGANTYDPPRSRHFSDASPDTAALASVQPGAEETRSVGPSVDELASTIDNMLRDHQRILQGICKDIGTSENPSQQADRTGGGSSDKQGELRNLRRLAALDAEVTIDMGNVTAAGREGGDSLDTELEDDEVDEALVVSRLQHRLARMEDEMTVIAAKQPAAGDDQQPQPDATTATTSAAATSDENNSTTVLQRPRRRARGYIDDAVVRRLRAFQAENFEFIAYNERLWNTSNVSQFVFAQRLSNALLEDCMNEVMSEVGTIMDDYVEGLAEHELQ